MFRVTLAAALGQHVSGCATSDPGALSSQLTKRKRRPGMLNAIALLAQSPWGFSKAGSSEPLSKSSSCLPVFQRQFQGQCCA